MSDLPASPKQVAYLSYMGISEAATMTRREASVRIDTLMDSASQEEWNWLYERQGEWLTDRFILYPDLYTSEFQRYLDDQLPDALHTYVRGRVTGAAETLTKAKIRKVIHAITAEDREWWRSPQRKEVFFDRLSRMFPGCCEGGPRVRSHREGPKIEQQRFSLLDHSTLGSLLRHYTEFCEPWEVTLSDGSTSGSPQELLESLDADWLTTQITEYRGDADGSHYTVTRKRLFGTKSRTFTPIWHQERHGWTDSGVGSKAVHYFVPRSWIVNPPYTSEGMLISLCKKAWISNGLPFYPVDPRRTFCRVCTSHHESWNNQQT
ncbi:hypothetical protein SAMN02745166_03150 [Prosthecobacter debontii]|uniref:Uncharacterized protein n=1 Tax=Prosthecobacter debontii TaxID=48467 RepID=A0A1T4YFM5_9BACT|nr:hypothetical protein SAMN02745166_03150 [Prosthecobacter debontii]